MSEVIELEDKMKRDLISTYLRHGFDDDDDLYFYVEHVLGYTIPRQKFCPEHVAPWDLVRDVFWERVFFAFAFGSRGSGKCLTGDSLILDPRTGLRHRLDSVVQNTGLDDILTMTEDGEVVQAPITARWYTGTNDCLRFTLSSGRSVTTTYEHPFMTAGGWCRAEELTIGEHVAIVASVPLPTNPVVIPDAHVDIMAVLLAEGALSHHQVAFSTADPHIVEIMSDACKHFDGVEVKWRSDYDYGITQGHRKGLYKRRNPVREMLDSYGIGHEKSDAKRVPDIIFQLGPRQLSRFLSVFWMCDGYVTRTEAEMILSSSGMVEDFQHLLLRFGIQSKARQKKDRAYRLTVYGPCNGKLLQAFDLWGMKRDRLLALVSKKRTGSASGRPPLTVEFIENVRSRLLNLDQSKRERGERSLNALHTLGWKTHLDGRQRRIGANVLYSGGIKAVMRERLAVLCDEKGMGSDGFELLLSPDIWWDPIRDIEHVGKVETYDLTMEPTASFVANDIIVHNTLQMALLNHLDMLYKQCGVEVCVAAATLDQSKRGYEYFKSMMDLPGLRDMIVDSIESKTTLTNGSKLQITAGTLKGLNGSHAQKVRVDEIEVMPYNLLDESLAISMSKKDRVHGKMIQAQDVWGSTRKVSSGTVSRVLEEAETKRMAVFPYCIWESVEQCKRKCHGDPEWGDCVIWDKCQGKAHECHGWYPVNDFILKAMNCSIGMFHAQFECKSPSGGEKVFGSHWDESIHVLSWLEGGKYKSFQSVFHEKEPPKSWRRVGGMDFGSNFAFILFAIEPRYGIWVAYEEYFYNKDRLMSRHADEILKLPGIERLHRIYGDPSAKQGILDMNALLKRKLKREVIVPGLNALLEGVDAVKAKLEVSPVNNLPKLFVLDTCTELRREFREWEHGSLPDGRVDLESFQDGNDHCLVAGTEVETSHGPVSIQHVQADDYVLTRYGYRRVLKSWMTDPSAQVYQIDLSNGDKLVGTGKHRVWVEGKGWIPLDALRYGDILAQLSTYKETEPWHDHELSSTRASSLGVTQTRRTGQTVCTTGHTLDTYEAGLWPSTGSTGETITGLFQMVGTCITRMATRLTTGWTTWDASQKQSITPTTLLSCQRSDGKNSENGWSRFARSPKRGTLHQKVVSGIESTVRRSGSTLSLLLALVSNAAQSLRLWPNTIQCAFALTSASLPGEETLGWMTSRRTVRSVVLDSGSTGTLGSGSAPFNVTQVVHVEALENREAVYNLTVEGEPEFFANGVLVHNCLDAARYGVFSHSRMPSSRYRFATVDGI